MGTEDNKLIADFMDIDYLGKNCTGSYDSCRVCDCKRELLYHSSWDWLMPVVEKIETITQTQNGVWIYRNICSLDNDNIKSQKAETKIEAVYNACIAFVKWHNKQSK